MLESKKKSIRETKHDDSDYSELSGEMANLEENSIPLRYGKRWFDALPNMGETYSYIVKNIATDVPWWKFWTKKWWLRTGLLSATTLNNAVLGSVSLPFATVGGISYGISKLSKWLTKKCFNNIEFDGFLNIVFSCIKLVVGSISWVIQKTTKWLGFGLLALSNAPLHLSNLANKKILTNLKLNKHRTTPKNRLEKLLEKQKNHRAELDEVEKEMVQLKSEIIRTGEAMKLESEKKDNMDTQKLLKLYNEMLSKRDQFKKVQMYHGYLKEKIDVLDKKVERKEKRSLKKHTIQRRNDTQDRSR